MRKINMLTAAGIASLAFASVPASAASLVFYSVLSGANEAPANASPATGWVRVTYDDMALTLRIESAFSGLMGTTTAAHIHCCVAAGVNGPVTISSHSSLPGFPVAPSGVTAGSFDQVYSLTDLATYRAAFVTANGGTAATAAVALLTNMQNGLTYFNIHTSAFGGGEIRGQLAPIPEPATWAMMLAGFGLAGAALRRRRVQVRYA